MKLVCISDTHGDHAKVALPAGDVLVHAGDITAHGTEPDLIDFLDWFAGQAFEHKIFIAGNHDTFLETNPEKTRELVDQRGLTYLNDSGIEIDNIAFWGSPITPRFFDWSFMRDPGVDINRHWLQIPANTKVLITHGPAFGVLDQVQRSDDVFEKTGCEYLLTRLQQLSPDVHIFGHIHEGYGAAKIGNTQCHNVSTMDMQYRICNAPVILDVCG